MLDKHPWPGNFRQLSNVIQIALLMADATEIKPWHLPDDFFDDLKNSEPMSPSAALLLPQPLPTGAGNRTCNCYRSCISSRSRPGHNRTGNRQPSTRWMKP